MLHHLTLLIAVDFVQVINVRQDVLKISDLAAVAKIVGTCALGDHVDGCAAPALNDCGCSPVLRFVLVECIGNQGAGADFLARTRYWLPVERNTGTFRSARCCSRW